VLRLVGDGGAGHPLRLDSVRTDRLLEPNDARCVCQLEECVRTQAPTPATGHEVCMVGRMPRMQVYLPDELYEAVKGRGLPASELLQEAVRAELRRQQLDEEAGRHVAELVAEVGEPSARERARAAAIARRIRERSAARAS
jgi:post-segregation antitoxin (ccd killing protein)